MAINDLYTDGLAKGWKIRDASTLTNDETLEADVVIVGSGAGGGTAAEILSAAGLSVLMLEEGGLYTSRDFKALDEFSSYSKLYQEAAGRATSDGAIPILQGRAVGGTTLVNWTTSIRTPKPTLEYWARDFGLKGSAADEMAPWFAKMEERLGIAPWAAEPNANNAVLRDGCDKLGLHWKTIPRNVRGCWNLGYCGLGCPVNAKQSMLVTTIPAALDRGMTLVHHARADRLQFAGGRVNGLTVQALDADTRHPTGITLNVRAKHYVLAGGAINTPALLLRSKAPDPHQRIGQRTCVHPVNASLAVFDREIDGFHGAPQSIYSDHFLWPEDGGIGYKLEVPPLQPMLASSVLARYGDALAQDMAQLPNTNVLIALMRDGFHEQSAGGRVRIDDSGQPVFDYDVHEPLWNALRHAFVQMAEIQFAAGAKSVRPAHIDAEPYASMDEARAAIAALPMRKHRAGLVTAHLMGGCAMGEDRQRCVIDSRGRHHETENLSIFDGSMFPSSIGANPQLTIYGFVSRNATALAEALAPAAKAAA
ncbi:GMC family oxidoreductase [Solimonas flava]|uniref:GMC family oxidoreductase n=1 Tax=Solimonas flava TaxID=415849 RepID=UPI000407C23A|nr:GMC family oxidoreductase [Solimonas flava]